MDINMKLYQPFVAAMNKNRAKYGEQMEKINGFHNSNLNFTDFIDNFVDTKVVADVTIDPNANSATHDINTLVGDMMKPHQKLLSYNKIFYEITKKYGLIEAEKWLENEWSGAFHMHDSASASQKPYCLPGTEITKFVLNGKKISASMEDIYNLVAEPEIEMEDGVKIKKPMNLSVLDYDSETKKQRYTPVLMVSKKTTDKNIVFVKAHNGCNLLTTEDHKYITNEGEIEAFALEENVNTLHTCVDESAFTGSIFEYHGLKLDWNMGWIIGMYLAEGYQQNGQLSICQSSAKSKESYDKIITTLDSIGIPHHEYCIKHEEYDTENNVIRLTNGDYSWERRMKKIFRGRHCDEKRLCEDYIHFNDDFLRGFLAGIIDGDGTVAIGKQLMIRMTSRTLINQIRDIGLHFGVFFGSRLPYIQSQRARIQQKRPMYSANVNMNRNKDFFLSLGSLKINEKFTDFNYDVKFANNNYTPAIGDMAVRDVSTTYKPSNIVYDLSTESHTFVCNDIHIHNCYAYDLEDLMVKGLFFIDKFKTPPAQHLTTFMDHVCEFVSWNANRTSGAVGLPTLLYHTYYFWYKDVKEGYYLKDPETYRRQCFQKFIYDINQPHMRIVECAFTNVSIMDREYLTELFGGRVFPNGECAIDHIEGLIEHQKVFMEVVSEIRSKNMMTFPVLSYALLYKDGKFVDEEFAHWCSDHNSKWYDSNFMNANDVSIFSNCCLDGSQEVVVQTDKLGVLKLPIRDFYNIPEEDRVNTKLYYFGKWLYGRVIRLPGRKMFKITLDDDKTILATDNHLHPTGYDDDSGTWICTPTSNLNTNHSLPVADNYMRSPCEAKWTSIKSIELVESTDNYCYCFEIYDVDCPYFMLPNGIITHNCRLLSDSSKLTGFINSIGGTALSIGSVKVNTINIRRVSLESGGDVEKFMEILAMRTLRCCEVLAVQRDIIHRNVEKGLLPNYTYGLIDFNKQYSTIGIIGIYEALCDFGLIATDKFGYKTYTDDAVAFVKRLFDTINLVKDNFKCDFTFNIECIPGESAARKLYEKDSIIYGDAAKIDGVLYSNQWIPLTAQCSMDEKIRLGSILDKLASGGQIAHINLESPISPEMHWNLLNKIAASGLMYFAFNPKISVCKNNHGFFGDTCPECGEPVSDYYSRIVGYLVPTKSYSAPRKAEFNERKWYKVE